jgi:hypothetical protein
MLLWLCVFVDGAVCARLWTTRMIALVQQGISIAAPLA